MSAPSEQSEQSLRTVDAVVLSVEDTPVQEATASRRGIGRLLRPGWRLIGPAWRLTGRAARQPVRASLAVPRALAAPLARGVTEPGPSAAFRHGGRDVSPEELAASYAGDRLLVLLAPPGRSERIWEAGRETTGATYAERFQQLLDWTPLPVRVAEDDPVAAAVAVSGLLQRYVDALADPPGRIVLLGAGAGGVLARNALGVAPGGTTPWTSLVTDVIALGAPPYAVTAAPLSGGVGRAIDEQLAGIAVLPAELIALPPAEKVDYVLVTDAAMSAPNPVSRLVGQLLWWRHKRPLRRRSVCELFSSAQRFELPTGSAPLSNHPDVHDALLRWLA